MFRSLLLLGLLGCNEPKQQAALSPAPAVIQVKDQAGTVTAELRPIRPCRATVGQQELIVGGPPILATVGSAQWMGDTGSAGTTFAKDGERIARVFPVGDPARASVLDMHGVAMARVVVTGGKAQVFDAASVPFRNLTKVAAGSAGAMIAIDTPPMTVTGTDDLVLAALLSAPELVPEVRMLAACERVLVKGS